MIPTISLVNIHHFTLLTIFYIEKTFRVYSLSNFQIYI